MLETGQLVAVGTGSPTIGLYRFSVDAFRVVDIYFLVVAKAFLVVYSVEVLFEVVPWAWATPLRCRFVDGVTALGGQLVGLAWAHAHQGYWEENPPRG